jgi:hypothetical protein
MPYNTPEKRQAYMARTKAHRSEVFKEWYNRQSPNRNRESYLRNRKERIQQSRKQYKKSGWARHLLKMYGIDADQYAAIFEFQDHKCAICGMDKYDPKNPWCVDHDHGPSKAVRGIICRCCNRVLGYMERRPKLLATCEAFKKYLENPPAQRVLKDCLPKLESIETPRNN